MIFWSKLVQVIFQGKFSVKARKTNYTPFKLRVDFREIGACTGGSLGGHSSDEGSRSPDSQSIEAAAAAAASAAGGVEAGLASRGVEAGLHSVCLIITAVPIVSAYSETDQVNPFGATFITRHSAGCVYSKVPYVGFEMRSDFIGYFVTWIGRVTWIFVIYTRVIL